MTDPKRCPKCDASLLQDSPAGLCPKCLLQAGFESAPAAEPAAESGDVDSPTVKSPAPGTTGFESPSPDALAPLFPQLEILELLGKGGMGAVYKARQKGLDRFVAVKILPPEVGRDPAFAERFTREARAMAKLSHPHIVAIYDFGQTDGQFYFVMEYIEGANLRQVIQAKQLSPAEALAIVPQICDALQYAHDEGIVHRDIKPENILVDKKGRVKIADFGLSKLLHHDQPDVSLTGTHQVMGTLRYMAPEQMQGTKSVDHRADIYSLGVVFYELLTGQVPMGRFDPPSQKVELDVRLDEVVLRALAQEPDKRYQQASDVKTDVEAVRSNTGDGARSRTSFTKTSTKIDFTPSQNPDEFATRGPAIGLISAGLLMLGLHCGFFLYGVAEDPSPLDWPFLASLAGIPFGVFVLLGGIAMIRLRSHALAMFGATMALVPVGPIWLLSLPYGVYSVFVLRRSQVKEAFARVHAQRTQPEFGSVKPNRGFHSGSPQVHLRFTVDSSSEVARLANFHFSALGYQLIDERPDAWVFHRGNKWAGLWETDIRGIFTILSVRTAPAAKGKSWVSCDWSIRRLGSIITRGDRAVLEGEGRGLAALLHANMETDAGSSSAILIEPRLSRCALIGGIWLAASIIAFGFAWPAWQIVLRKYFDNPAEFQAIPQYKVALALLVALGAITAPFGPTILGGVAVAQIRRSNGMLYGLPLAFADMMFFPLLAVAAAISLGIGFATVAFWPTPTPGPDNPAVANIGVMHGAIPGSIVAFVVCYFVGRAVWRMVSPLSSNTAAKALPSAESDQDYARRNLTGPAVALMIAAVVNMLGSIAWAVMFLDDAQSPAGYFTALAIPAWDIVIGGFVLLGAAGGLLRGETSAIGDFAIACSLIIPPGLVIAIPAVILYWVRCEDPRIKRVFQATEAAPATETTQTWQEWWNCLPRSVLRVMHVSCTLVYSACVLAVFGYRGTGTTSPTDPTVPSRTFAIGQPSPWFEYYHHSAGMGSSIKLLTWSTLVAAVGLAALWAMRKLEQQERGKVHAMWWHYGLWTFLLVLAIAVGTFSGMMPARKIAIPKGLSPASTNQPTHHADEGGQR